MQIISDPLESPAVIRLLEEHLSDMYATSPAESVHALDISKLKTADIHFWTAWQQDIVLGCAALKRHSNSIGEIKSMRTAAKARGKGVGRTLLQHILHYARQNGFTQLYLETGSMEFFAPARSLYLSEGFSYCGPFADYREDPNSVFMSINLDIQ